MELSFYQKQIQQFFKFPKENAINYLLLGISGESGEISEKFKKLIRDKYKKMPSASEMEIEEKIAVIKEIGDVLFYLAALSYELGYDFDEVAELNLDKLNSRQMRGVIGGSGDER